MNHEEHTKLLEDFVTCLEEERFYDAHEALEEIWFPRRFEGNDEIKLLKGFINAAVSFELRKRGRPEASQKVWKNYLKYKKLLHKIESPFLEEYCSISSYIESINSRIYTS